MNGITARTCWQGLQDAVSGACDLLWPPVCCVCSSATGAFLCDRCLAQRTLITGEICSRCGRPDAERFCPDCGEAPWMRVRPCDSMRQTALFEGAFRTAIHRYKFDGMRCLADPLSLILTEWLQGASAKWTDVDAVACVPGSLLRGWELGFHHSYELARRVARFLETPMVQALKRLHGPSQVGLSRQQRLQNARRIYGLRAQGPDVTGLRILVVDDVITTGATADAVAEKLKSAGAASVRMLALARTVESPPDAHTHTTQASV